MKRVSKTISYLLALYCVLMPFEEALASSLGSILRLVGIVLIIVILGKYYKKGIYIHKFNSSIVLWLIYMIISFAWASDIHWWSYFLRIYIVQIILLNIIELVPIYAIDLKAVEKALIIGAFFAASILILFPTASGFTDEGRRTIMLLGTTLDPNVVASIILLGVQIALKNFFENKIHRYIDFLIAAWLMVGVLFTGSRGVLMAFIGGFAVEICMKLSRRGERKKAVGLLIVALLSVGIIRGFLPENLLETRFSSSTILGLNEYQSGSHNRYTIWEHAIILIKRNPVFGYGCGNFFSAIATVYRTCASHNLYILLLVEGGIIGFGLFMSYIAKLLKNLSRFHDTSRIALLVTVLIMSCSLDSITYKYFWIALIYARLVIRKHMEETKLEGEKNASF